MVNVTHTLFLFTVKDSRLFKAREMQQNVAFPAKIFKIVWGGMFHPYAFGVSMSLFKTPLSTILDPPLLT